MTKVVAKVSQGRLVADAPSELREGAEVTLLVVDASDEMTAEESADLDAELDRARGEIAAGRGISADELLERVRTS